MTRKSALLLIILLIGGGGGAFYLHLRNQAPPEFREVDQFLRQSLPTSEWALAETEDAQFTTLAGPSWLVKIGIHRIKKFPRTHYVFADPRVTGAVSVVAVIVTHDSQRVTDVMVLGSPADVEEFKAHLFGEFPKLRHVYVEP